MSDARDRLEKLLDGNLEAADIAEDASLVSLADRLYGIKIANVKEKSALEVESVKVNAAERKKVIRDEVDSLREQSNRQIAAEKEKTALEIANAKEKLAVLDEFEPERSVL